MERSIWGKPRVCIARSVPPCSGPDASRAAAQPCVTGEAGVARALLACASDLHPGRWLCGMIRFGHMRVFLTLVALVLAACASPGPAGSRPANSNPGAQVETESECLALGGRWGRVGLVPQPRCALPTRDGGKACRDHDEREGLCIAPPGTRPGSVTTGACRHSHENTGCLIRVSNGRAGWALCSD